MSKQASPRPSFRRNLPRLAYLYALIPLALIVGLYAGYGRLARLDRAQRMCFWDSAFYRIALEEFRLSINSFDPLPFYGISRPSEYGDAFSIYSEDVARVMLLRWKSQRDEASKRAYYARYALLLHTDPTEYERTMRQGERDDPDNAIYPMLLANHYLSNGIHLDSISGNHTKWKFSVTDRSSLDKGITELCAAMKKPYFRSYVDESVRLEANHLPRPHMIEDYLVNEGVWLGGYTDYFLLRKIERYTYCAARTLAAEGKKDEAEALMDYWKPCARLFLDNAVYRGARPRTAAGFPADIADGAANIYGILGAEKKKYQALFVKRTAEQISDELEAKEAVTSNIYNLHAPKWSIGISSRDNSLSKASLTPLRMHEHLLIEDLALGTVITFIMLFIAILWLQGIFWNIRLRKEDNSQRALIPTWREAARILLLGVILPLVIYYIYTRLPVIGGRDYGWGSPQWPRFISEIIVLGTAIIFFTALLTRQWVRRKCAEEGIDTPNPWVEARVAWTVRILAVLAIPFFRESYSYSGWHTNFDYEWLTDSLPFEIPDGIFTPTFFGLFILYIGFWLLMRKIWLTEKYGPLRQRGMIITLCCIIAAVVTGMVAALITSNKITIFRDVEFNYAAFFVFALLFLAAMMTLKPTPYGRYYGTLARTLAPVYACVILLIALAALPAVRTREAYWLRQDRYFGGMADKGPALDNNSRAIIEKLRAAVE